MLLQEKGSFAMSHHFFHLEVLGGQGGPLCSYLTSLEYTTAYTQLRTMELKALIMTIMYAI